MPSVTTNCCNDTITQYNVQTGSATNTLNQVAPGATGIPLISQGASSQPAFSTATVPGGGTGNTTFTAYSVITAGTTATGTFQNVSGVGTQYQLLTSAGAGALPTWVGADSTWMPTAAFGGASVGVTYSQQDGNYSAVGNLIFFNFSVTLTSKGSSTGNLQISLPIAVTGNGARTVSFINGLTMPTGQTFTTGYAVPGQSFMSILACGNVSGAVNVTNSNISGTSSIYGSGVYMIN